MSAKGKAYAALLLGLLVLPWAAILIRQAGREAHSLFIAGGRLLAATLILTPIALLRGAPEELRGLSRRQWCLLIFSGIALALHFGTWISSLALTTVASSVILVATYPFFVGLASHFLLKERLSRLTAGGIALSIAGSVVIGYGDLGLEGPQLLGDLLALIGAATAAAYFLVGRRLRQRLSVLSYIWPVYAVAAAVLSPVALLLGEPLTGYSLPTWIYILLLALGPQLLGHSSLNYALEQLSAVFVTVVALGEPLGSAVLAFLLLGEAPPHVTLLGGALILAGIVLTSRGER
ncbi:MAG: DMT family transporter [Chloroflexia bacterium]|nr:DMT family transporter [Chloroflexia bacterium]